MAEPTLKDRTYSIIRDRFVETGQAPHYTEIAAELGVSTREGKAALHELFSTRGFAGWLYPKGDTVISFAPFNNLPTQYRLTIDGEQKWFAQGAFESLAVCWLFPGKTVQIDTVCLDCGEPMQVKVKDGKIESKEPEGLIGYVAVPFARWMLNIAYSGSTMNFFRSEEHLRKWEGYQEKKKEGIISLDSLMQLFAGPFFKDRGSSDYVSRQSEYMADFMAELDKLPDAGNYWKLSSFEKAAFNLAMKMGLM